METGWICWVLPANSFAERGEKTVRIETYQAARSGRGTIQTNTHSLYLCHMYPVYLEDYLQWIWKTKLCAKESHTVRCHTLLIHYTCEDMCLRVPVFQNVSKGNVHSWPAPIGRGKGTNHNKELHPLDLQSLAKDQAATNLHVFTQVCASCCQAAGEATLRMGGNLSPGDL